MKPPFVLVLGENGSGKSLYAESLVRKAPQARRVYIATMQPYGEEGQARVNKHRAQRAGDGYETLELPRGIHRARVKGAIVLLEDVSNLVANTVFDTAAPGGAEEALEEIDTLRAHCGALVAVSVRMPGPEDFSGETASYIAAVDAVNRVLAERADTVVELRDGVPSVKKGELPW